MLNMCTLVRLIYCGLIVEMMISALSIFERIKQHLRKENLGHWVAELTDGGKVMSFRLKHHDKGVFVKDYLQEETVHKLPFDYAISVGDGDADEPMHRYMNDKGLLSIIVDHPAVPNAQTIPQKHEEPLRKTVAQFRTTGVSDIRQLIEYIAIERSKKHGLQTIME